MSEHNSLDQIKAKECVVGSTIHTHCHVAEVQFGAETWAIEKAEKKHKEASGAMTRKRNISCLTALRVRGLDETGHSTQMRHFEGLIEAPCDGNFCH
jgi:hypothetical protein